MKDGDRVVFYGDTKGKIVSSIYDIEGRTTYTVLSDKGNYYYLKEEELRHVKLNDVTPEEWTHSSYKNWVKPDLKPNTDAAEYYKKLDEKLPDDYWDEDRTDVIGQKGNDGLHYEQPKEFCYKGEYVKFLDTKKPIDTRRGGYCLGEFAGEVRLVEKQDDNFVYVRSLDGRYMYALPVEGIECVVEKPDNVSKYHKVIKGVEIDVYDVLDGFKVYNPAIQHAVKKLLMGGNRGYKSLEQDYLEAIESIKRGIELNAD